MKKRNLVMILAAFLLVMSGLAGCKSKQASIDVNAYVKLEFEGYDSLGRIAGSEFEARKLINDNEKALDGVSKKDILKLFEEAFSIQTEDEGHLKNGENIKIRWDVDEDDLAEFEKEHKVKFVYDDFSYEVEGLEKMDTVDIFDGITVSFDGTAPDGRARISNESDYYSIVYRMDKSSGLSNGDVITVTASFSNDSVTLAEGLAAAYHVIPQTETKQFTVSGLSAYVTELSQLPDAVLKEMDQAVQKKLAELTKSWNYPDSYQGATYMGPVFASATGNSGTLYLVYKIDIDSARDGAMSYFAYGRYKGLILDGTGTLTTDIENSTYVMSDSFTVNGLRYTGFQHYEDLEQRVFGFGSEYTVTDKVDRSIITKVTHTPTDYGKITATPVFTADCFAYKVMEGSNIVIGFTQKGYDLIHSFATNDCISILLPEVTDTGEAVEGFQSLGNGSGTYAVKAAFDDAAPCAELVCPDSYTKFYGFSSNGANYKIRSIVLGQGIKTLSNRAFYDCNAIRELTIPDGVDTIPDNAFEACKSLTKVTFPETLTFIKSNVFSGCTSLTEANLPEGIQEIGSYAFSGCENLVLGTLEMSGKKIGENAFKDVTIKEIRFTENGFTSSHKSSWGTIYSQWIGAKVAKITIGPDIVRIPDYAFESCDGVTEIVIPEGVTEIGIGAFTNCKTLEKVTLPESLVTISESAFAGCDALKSINLPKELKTIGNYAFQNCPVLVIDALDMSGKTIGVKAFEGVTFQKLIVSTEDYATTFYTSWGNPYAPWGGANAKEIEIGADVKRIPDYAFAYCQGFTDILIPETVEEIGTAAFLGCQSLKTVTFHDKIYGIDDNAFADCTSLKNAEIPATTGYIGTGAFNNCNSLVIETFELGKRKIGTNAFCQVTINKVVLSGNTLETLRYVSWGTVYTHFADTNIKVIEITDGVTEIPEYAFEYIKTVAEITVPETVTKISKEAFSHCENLRKLHLPASVKDIDTTALDGCSDLTVYAPEGSVGAAFAQEHGFFFKAEE